MALWGELWHMFLSELWQASHSGANGGACHCPLGMPATPEQILGHTMAHVPEHTIAFQRTLEQAMALQDKLWHSSHSIANSGVNCRTCARAYYSIPENSGAGNGPPE
ncbi:hypothetical protein F5J12DRAFT_784881 [Pisolithus orientalis]|uniref:uncharacterized protein n=1 Tax=Pisolithus orientalis TaxID=936130 RepID=UPI002224DBDA|nr:uncharacterized protein F5J12DRAFT_784881 [Pisolithus orientalis]KAI5998541.1 hypothetical protein F5J12DRAFT_784881 [Pisolithus orientalis]